MSNNKDERKNKNKKQDKTQYVPGQDKKLTKKTASRSIKERVGEKMSIYC